MNVTSLLLIVSSETIFWSPFLFSLKWSAHSLLVPQGVWQEGKGDHETGNLVLRSPVLEVSQKGDHETGNLVLRSPVLEVSQKGDHETGNFALYSQVLVVSQKSDHDTGNLALCSPVLVVSQVNLHLHRRRSALNISIINYYAELLIEMLLKSVNYGFIETFITLALYNTSFQQEIIVPSYGIFLKNKIRYCTKFKTSLFMCFT